MYRQIDEAVQFSCSVMSDSANPWTAAHQASQSITNSWSLLKLMSMELVMPSNHLICHPLLLLPSIFPGIRVFSNESVLHISWPKYWSFSFSISPSTEYSGLIPLGLTGWISLQSKGLSRVFSNTAKMWPAENWSFVIWDLTISQRRQFNCWYTCTNIFTKG